MPKYYAAGVNIRLSTTNPTLSLSTAPTNHMAGEFAREVIRVEAELLKGQTLGERLICLKSDVDHPDLDNPLSFLGKDYIVPFYCCRVQIPQGLNEANSADDEETLSNVTAQQTNAELTNSVSIRLNPPNIEDETLLDTSSSLSSLQSTPIPSPALSGSLLRTRSATMRQSLPSADAEAGNEPKVELAAVFTPSDQVAKQHVQPSAGAPTGPSHMLLDPRITEQPSTRALALMVELDKILSFSRKIEKAHPQDIKIDVFFNGQRTHCTFISQRLKKEKASTKFYFSGARVARLIEAAWIVFPPSKTSLNSEEEPAFVSGCSAEERWQAISNAIAAEADLLGFADQERPPSGEYLETLSNLAMPAEIKSCQTTESKLFGVVDVVVTLGTGKKYPVSDGFLKQPTNLKNSRYMPNLSKLTLNEKPSTTLKADSNFTGNTEESVPQIGEEMNSVLSSVTLATTTPPTSERFGWLSDLEVAADHDVSPVPLKKRKTNSGMAARSDLLKHSPIQRLARSPLKDIDTSPFGPPAIYLGAIEPDLQQNNPDLPSTKLRSTTQRYLTRLRLRRTKEPYEERNEDSKIKLQIKPSLGKSSEQPFSLSRLFKSQNWKKNKKGSTPPKAVEAFKVQTPKQQRTTKVKTSNKSKISSALSMINEASLLPILKRKRGRKLAASSTDQGVEGSAGHSTGDQNQVTPRRRNISMELIYRPPAFSMPELSKNSIVSYLAPSDVKLHTNPAHEISLAQQQSPIDRRMPQRNVPEVGAFRQTRCERGGDFEESEVLLGCRYIVGV